MIVAFARSSGRTDTLRDAAEPHEGRRELRQGHQRAGLELSGGFSSVTGELEGAWLRTFQLAGGVDRLRLRLPAPRDVAGPL